MFLSSCLVMVLKIREQFEFFINSRDVLFEVLFFHFYHIKSSVPGSWWLVAPVGFKSSPDPRNKFETKNSEIGSYEKFREEISRYLFFKVDSANFRPKTIVFFALIWRQTFRNAGENFIKALIIILRFGIRPKLWSISNAAAGN